MKTFNLNTIDKRRNWLRDNAYLFEMGLESETIHDTYWRYSNFYDNVKENPMLIVRNVIGFMKEIWETVKI